MIDAPGPWGSGPFVLAEGHSSLDTEQAVTSEGPFACTWLQRQDRTPQVRLRANTDYWDAVRGPHLREIVFRNDLSRSEALDLVCDGEGEVDIVTEVPATAGKGAARRARTPGRRQPRASSCRRDQPRRRGSATA